MVRAGAPRADAVSEAIVCSSTIVGRLLGVERGGADPPPFGGGGVTGIATGAAITIGLGAGAAALTGAAF